MKQIVSLANNTVKETASLKEAKGRAETRCFLVEGEKLVAAAIIAGLSLERLFCLGGMPDGLAEYADGPNVFSVTPQILQKITDTVQPQPVVGVFRIPDSKIQAPTGNCLILDRVRDPGNLGAILRTAAATNFSDVYLIDCADAYAPKVVRSSMSGLFYVRCYTGSTYNTVAELIKPVCEILCADMGGSNAFEYSSKGRIALAIGNEAQGLSQQLVNLADGTLSIPMKNIESLNAAVSAGILMYRLSAADKF